MNNEQTTQALAILKAAYPDSFRGMTRQDAEAMIALWSRQFKEDDPRIVGAAIDRLIANRTSNFTPTIGEVKAEIQKIKSPQMLSETEAWALVSKACQNGYYGYREEFAKLPPEVQRAVGRPEQLREWSVVDVKEFQTVIASNFMRGYKTIQAREKENEALPASVKELIEELAGNMKMLNAGDEK